jgi:hypothetical protein
LERVGQEWIELSAGLGEVITSVIDPRFEWPSNAIVLTSIESQSLKALESKVSKPLDQWWLKNSSLKLTDADEIILGFCFTLSQLGKVSSVITYFPKPCSMMSGRYINGSGLVPAIDA